MRSNFSYWFTDFAVGILTFDSFIFNKLITNYINTQKIKSILDLGSGTGTQARLFPKSKYLGLDNDSAAIEYSKKRYKGYNFLVGDATNFRLNKKFDFILIVGVLHHLNDKQVVKCLHAVGNHLNKKGTVMIIEAIPPLSRLNLIGKLLRSRDRGNHIRTLKAYKKLLAKPLKINDSKNIFGGFFDYGFFILSHPQSKSKS